MEDDPTDDLHVEVFHAQTSPRTLSAHCKCLRQNSVQGLSLLDPFLKFFCLFPQLLVGQLLIFCIISHDLVCDFGDFLYFLFIQISKDFFHKTHLSFPFLES